MEKPEKQKDAQTAKSDISAAFKSAEEACAKLSEALAALKQILGDAIYDLE